MKKLFYLLLVVFCFSCNQNTKTEKYQKSRKNKISVQSRIQELQIDTVLISKYARVYTMGDYLLISDAHSLDKSIHLFDKKDFRYLVSTAYRGEGPNEITILGHVGVDEVHKKFYVTDHGKMKIFSFDLDSVLNYPDYIPQEKVKIRTDNFPTEYVYFSDTLCVGRTISPKGTNDYTPYVSRWNMLSGEITPISPYSEMKHKRILFAASFKYSLALELYTLHDLISIMDINGNLKCNIYGPQWDSDDSEKIHYFGDAVFCRNNKFIVSYSGGNYRTEEYYPTHLLIFDIDGNYIQTLDAGYKITHFCYDEDNNRLIFAFNDDIQFGYLSLEGII